MYRESVIDLPCLARGVYEDASVPAGYRQFRAIAADGTELVSLRVQARAETELRRNGPDPVLMLRQWLNAADPQLRLVTDDDSRGGISPLTKRASLSAKECHRLERDGL